MDKLLYLANLHEVGLGDLEQVGGKNASLGEMLQNLAALGILIPGGFIVTVSAYREFLRFNSLDESIRTVIGQIDFSDIESLREVVCKQGNYSGTGNCRKIE